MARIINMKFTPEETCLCGNWLRHWERYSGQTLACCVEVNCTGKSLVGVHVQKVNSIDGTWYIIPLCHDHSITEGEIEISDSYRLVPADTLQTCERVNHQSSSPLPLPLSESPRNY